MLEDGECEEELLRINREYIFSSNPTRVRICTCFYLGTIFDSRLRAIAFWDDCLYARYYGIFSNLR